MFKTYSTTKRKVVSSNMDPPPQSVLVLTRALFGTPLPPSQHPWEPSVAPRS